jgi:hypothetical protein
VRSSWDCSVTATTTSSTAPATGMWAQLVQAVALVHVAARQPVRGGEDAPAWMASESWLDWLAPYAEYRTEVEEPSTAGKVFASAFSGRLAGSTRVKLAPPAVHTVTTRDARFGPMPTGRSRDRGAAGLTDGLLDQWLSSARNNQQVRHRRRSM